MNIFYLFFLYLIISTTIICFSKQFKFYDIPSSRKIHSTKVINTGGVILYFYYLLTAILFEFNHNIELIISIGFFICLTGFVDDRINLSPSNKILFILMPSMYLLLNNITIYDLGRYELLGTLYLGKLQIPFLILAICLLVNATNYIDGVDGLLLIFFICFLCNSLFFVNDGNTYNLIIILLIPLIFNLFLNFLPIKFKVISGDSGSLFVGFFVGFFTIELYNSFKIHPVFLIWPLWYPVYDFLFVTFRRIVKKKPFFNADNNHLHHKILKKFKNNHLKTALLFLISNSLIIYFGYLISSYSRIISLITFALGFFAYISIRLIEEKK